MLEPMEFGDDIMGAGGSCERGCWPPIPRCRGLCDEPGPTEFKCNWLLALMPIPCRFPGGSMGRSGRSSSSDVAMVLIALW